MTANEPPPDSTLIPLTRNEIRHLLAEILKPVHHPHHVLHWSTLRRACQAVARACHYKRQTASLK
jgi:hypothetical protein